MYEICSLHVSRYWKTYNESTVDSENVSLQLWNRSLIQYKHDIYYFIPNELARHGHNEDIRKDNEKTKQKTITYHRGSQTDNSI